MLFFACLPSGWWVSWLVGAAVPVVNQLCRLLAPQAARGMQDLESFYDDLHRASSASGGTGGAGGVGGGAPPPSLEVL